MSISLATKQAYSEVYEFINMLDATIINKVPVYILKLFEEERDKNYIKKIDTTLPIKEQGLKEETLAIIAMLNLEYLCEDEEEKQKLKEQYKKNQELVEEAEKIEFNIDAFEKAFAYGMEYNGPYLIEVTMNMDEFVLPMLPPGGSIDDIIVEKEGQG